MKIKRNNERIGIKFSDIKIGIVFEDDDGKVYLKIGSYTLINENDDVVNAIDLETNLLCYIEPEEIVYTWKNAYISLEK